MKMIRLFILNLILLSTTAVVPTISALPTVTNLPTDRPSSSKLHITTVV